VDLNIKIMQSNVTEIKNNQRNTKN